MKANSVKKIFLLIFTIFICSSSVCISNSASNLPQANTYNEFRNYFVDAVLLSKPTLGVQVNEYDKDIYSINRLVSDIDMYYPEQAYLLKSAGAQASGYSNSKVRVVKFDIEYKNSKEDLSNIFVVRDQKDLSNIVRYSFQNYQEKVLVKILNYPSNKFDLEKIVQNVCFDNPGYGTGFDGFLTNVYGRGNDCLVHIKFKFVYPIAKIKDIREQADNKATQVIGEIIKPNMEDYEKELAIHDYIVNNVDYDKINFDKNTITPESRAVYGVLIDKVAVCEGYALTMRKLLDLAGVESTVVTGSSKGVAHAWNIVKIQKKYYQLDATWDDPMVLGGGKTLEHTYFNVTDDKMKTDHLWERKDYPVCDSIDFNYNEVVKAIANKPMDNNPNTNVAANPDGTINPNGTTNPDGTINPNAATNPSGTLNADATVKPNGAITPDSTVNPANQNGKNIIKFAIGNKIFEKNSIPKEIDPGRSTVPIVDNGRTLVPVRIITESLGGVITWDGLTSTAIIKKDNINISLKIGSSTVKINGKDNPIDVPAKIIDGRTFLPLRFISENFGCKVDWNQETKEILITY